MKHLTRVLLLVAWFALNGFVSLAEPHQIVAGTQIHLKLLTNIGTASSRHGDPFMAVTTEPLMNGDRVVLPAGTHVHGLVTAISPAHHFALFRGEAYLNLAFHSMEVDGRLIPVEMSVLAVDKPSVDGESHPRKDLDVSEGQLLQQKHDIKGDIIAGTIGTGGATLIGSLAAHAAAGFGIGLAGSALYVAARKGREVYLPAETPMLVRMDKAVTVPGLNSQSSGTASGH